MDILKVNRKTTSYAWTDGDHKERRRITRKAKNMIKAEIRKTFAEVMAAKLA